MGQIPVSNMEISRKILRKQETNREKITQNILLILIYLFITARSLWIAEKWIIDNLLPHYRQKQQKVFLNRIVNHTLLLISYFYPKYKYILKENSTCKKINCIFFFFKCRVENLTKIFHIILFLFPLITSILPNVLKNHSTYLVLNKDIICILCSVILYVIFFAL